MLATVFRGSRLSNGANDAALEGEMRRGITPFEDSGWRDELAWLLLRVIAELSPCTTNSLIAHVSADISAGEAGRASHTRKLVLDALLKLEILDLIDSSQDQILLTEKGRRRNEAVVRTSQHRGSWFASLRALVLSEFGPRLTRLSQGYSPSVRVIMQRVLHMNGERASRLSGIAIQIWHRNAPIISSKATILVATVAELLSLGRVRAEALGTILANSLRASIPVISTWAKDIRAHHNAKYPGLSWPIIYGAALSVIVIGGGLTVLTRRSPETTARASTDLFLVHPERASRTEDAAEADALRKLVAREEAADATTTNGIDRQPTETSAVARSSVEHPAGGLDGTPGVSEEAAVDPVIVAIRSQLADPAFRKRIQSDDLAALQSLYDEHDGPTLWMTGAGLTVRARAVISEIQHADEWGLSAAAFDLPAAENSPVTAESQAREEIKLGLAILQYARSARGGRLSPSRISSLFDQRPHLLDPKTVLTEIAASPAPDAYCCRYIPSRNSSSGCVKRSSKRELKAKPAARTWPMSATFSFSSSIWSAGAGCPPSLAPITSGTIFPSSWHAS
jgi:L,D-transpeptidase-like protein